MSKEDISMHMKFFNEIHRAEKFEKAVAKQQNLRKRREAERRREKKIHTEMLQKQTMKIVESGDRTPSQPNNSPTNETEESLLFGSKKSTGVRIY